MNEQIFLTNYSLTPSFLLIYAIKMFYFYILESIFLHIYLLRTWKWKNQHVQICDLLFIRINTVFRIFSCNLIKRYCLDIIQRLYSFSDDNKTHHSHSPYLFIISLLNYYRTTCMAHHIRRNLWWVYRYLLPNGTT